MSKKLVIVESPAKAKTIKKYLGSDYKVVASMGHIRDLPKSQLGVDIEKSFEPKYITIRGKGDLLAKLKKDAKTVDKVLLATDPDREGEAISWHLAQSLDIDLNTDCRICFNEITKKALKEAVNTSRPIDIDLVNAQQTRRILDRIVGYKLSPLLWKKVKKGLSAGRVQSTVTKLVVDREREIEAFVPEEYWNITAKLSAAKGQKPFLAKFYGIGAKKTAVTNQEMADDILRRVKDVPFKVADVKYFEKQKNPAPPFITSSLLQDASRKLGFTSKRTMATAQMLYEGVNVPGHGAVGLITYMRTDSLRIADEAVVSAKEYILKKFGKAYVPPKPRIFKSRKSAQDAHEAIRPSAIEITPEDVKPAGNDLYKLYKLIWERFLASQMASSVYDAVNADITANDCLFKTSGMKIKFKGFETLYASPDEDEETAKTIPNLSANDILINEGVDAEQKFTEPPSRYTEGTLMKTMEEKGIGRPSTYAPTVTTILARGYVTREKKLLKPTELGIITTDLMNEYFNNIINIKFTADMEKNLDLVEEGEVDWVAILKDFYEPFDKVLKNAESTIEKIETPDEVSDVVCDKCGRMMVYKLGRFGRFLACPGFPECRNTKAIIIDTGVKCHKCGGKIVERKSQKGKKYFACENSAKCGVLFWDKPTGKTCEKCGSVMVEKFLKSGKKVVCSNSECK